MFTSHKWASFQDVVKWFDYFHIGVEINTAEVVENPKARIIAYESVFFCFVGFCGVGYDVYIKVVFVPLLDFVVGEELFPAVDAFNS